MTVSGSTAAAKDIFLIADQLSIMEQPKDKNFDNPPRKKRSLDELQGNIASGIHPNRVYRTAPPRPLDDQLLAKWKATSTAGKILAVLVYMGIFYLLGVFFVSLIFL